MAALHYFAEVTWQMSKNQHFLYNLSHLFLNLTCQSSPIADLIIF